MRSKTMVVKIIVEADVFFYLYLIFTFTSNCLRNRSTVYKHVCVYKQDGWIDGWIDGFPFVCMYACMNYVCLTKFT